MPGSRRLGLPRCLERDGVYLPLVEWERPEDRTEGFRESSRHQRWRTPLNHVHEPSPVVDHVTRVLRA